MKEKNNLTLQQQLKLAKQQNLLSKGIKKKLITPYPDYIFDHLRPYSIGGIPASILLFVTDLCNGYCYDRADLMSLAFSDSKIIHANIETLRIQTGGKELAGHAFVETNELVDGKTVVIDTSLGLVYDKDYYYKIEKPEILNIITKEEQLASPIMHEIIISDFQKEKYTLPLIMPIIDTIVETSNHIGTFMYRKKVKHEIELFKKAINYECLKAEIEQDIKLMKSDPKKLDEKNNIIRDKNNREISRGGIPNPYYISPEELEKETAYLKSIKDNKEKLDEYYTQLINKSLEEIEKEEMQTAFAAKVKLEQIKKAPTANFYEEQQNI